LDWNVSGYSKSGKWQVQPNRTAFRARRNGEMDMARPETTNRLFEAHSRSNALVEFDVHANSRAVSPTLQVSAEWQFAFSYFNGRLFDNTLPDCVITFTEHPLAQGYFCAEAFRDRKGTTAHKIALNPIYFAMGDAESFATLVHEMTHMWRHLFGPRNRKGGYGVPGYHDVVWAEKMKSIGLMPSSTGRPGGRQTGFKMNDYPIEGGAFDLACRELLISGHVVNWREGRDLEWTAAPFPHDAQAFGDATASGPKPRRGSTRVCFACARCGLRAWSRPSARISCTDCNQPMRKQ
jgi:hypothetical protein